MITNDIQPQKIKNQILPFLPLLWRGIEGEVKNTIMRKLLIYLLLFACFESFISATPCYCFTHKDFSHTTDINILNKDETLQQDNIDNEIHPLDIFTLHYF